MEEDEIWEPVPGYEHKYDVSNLGNVRCRDYRHTGKTHILTPGITKAGYKLVKMYRNGSFKQFKVHQLVAMAFLGHNPCGYKLVVDHINNNRSDDRLINLQVVTQRKNMIKDRPTGTSIYTGVNWYPKYNKWISRITINRKRVFLGYFDTEFEAAKAFQNALKGVYRN